MIRDKNISRESLLKNLEFHGSYYYCKQKPSSLTQTTICLDGDSIVLFGGMSGERTCDVWICNLQGI